jgi:urease accessory protein
VFSVTQLEKVIVCRYLGQRMSQAKALFGRAWDVLRTACQGKPASAPRIWAT